MRTVSLLFVIAAILYSAFYFTVIWIPIGICLVPALLIALVHGERINILSGRKLGLLTAMKGNSLALVGAFIIPGRITELLKPLYYYRRKQFPVPDGLSVVVVERIFDIVMIAALTALAIQFVALPSSAFEASLKGATILLVVTLIALLFGAFRFPRSIEKLITLMPSDRARRFLLASFQSFREVMKLGLGSWSIILTVAVWSGSVGLYWLFLRFDGGVDLAFDQTLVVFLVGTLGITVTVTPGGVGTFEAAVTLVLQQYGYVLDVALASAVGLRLVAFVPNALVAGYVLAFEGVDLIRIKRSADD